MILRKYVYKIRRQCEDNHREKGSAVDSRRRLTNFKTLISLSV